MCSGPIPFNMCCVCSNCDPLLDIDFIVGTFLCSILSRLIIYLEHPMGGNYMLELAKFSILWFYIEESVRYIILKDLKKFEGHIR